MKKLVGIITLLFLLCGATALGQSRPSEDSMFGQPSENAPVKTQNKTPSKAPPQVLSKTHEASSEKNGEQKGGRNEAKELNSPGPERDAFASGEVVDNPLQIGGLFYQRMIMSAQQGVNTNNTPISMPLQFDAFLDGRPSDRIRGFIDERLLYDSTRDPYGNPTGGSGYGNTQFFSSSTAPTGLFGTTATAAIPNNPQTVLDQAWLKFDIERTVFVTVGKQHVKWGASRYWNPTDFLNTQIRDPLLPYDLRLGNSMMKLELPFEAQKTNIYAISLFDNPQPASSNGQLGEAFRIEKVFGSTEIGLDAVYRGNAAPTYGVDLSAPLGDFDVYLEGAYRTAPRNFIYQLPNGLSSATDVTTQYTMTGLSGPQVAVSGGVNYSFAWRENRQATLGIEYFYNQAGYTNSSAYPILLFLGQYQPFYTGRNYGAIYLTLEGPDSQKHTSYTISTLSNLSDSSFISRVDFSWRFLTYLTFEAYADGHYGTQGGEFNFAINTPSLTFQGAGVAAISVPVTTFDVGLGLRLSF